MDGAFTVIFFTSLLQGGIVSGAEIFVNTEEMVYSDADTYCKQNNGTMIMFDSKEKWDTFVVSDTYTVTLSNVNFWIGNHYQAAICGGTGCFDTNEVAWWCQTFVDTCNDVDMCIHVHQKNVQIHRKACSDKNVIVCERGVTQATTTTEQPTTTTTATTSATSLTTTTPLATTTTTTPATTTTETPTTTTAAVESTTPTSSNSESTTATICVTQTAHIAEETTTHATASATTAPRMTQEELLEAITKLRQHLTIAKTNTSLYRRQFISIYEDRPTSITLGSVAILFLVFAISIIVVPDVFDMIRFFNRRKKLEHHKVKF